MNANTAPTLISRDILSELQKPERPPHRKLWTRDDCGQLERVGVLSPPFELLEGEIIEKSGQGWPHSMVNMRVLGYLLQICPPDQVLPRLLLEVAEADRRMNFPMPDVFVSEHSAMIYKAEISGADSLLTVEVSDASLLDDLTVKAALYARAGVPDYWVVDVNGRRIFAHRKPTDGIYQSVTVYAETESIAPEAAPDSAVSVSSFFPPLRPGTA